LEGGEWQDTVQRCAFSSAELWASLHPCSLREWLDFYEVTGILPPQAPVTGGQEISIFGFPFPLWNRTTIQPLQPPEDLEMLLRSLTSVEELTPEQDARVLQALFTPRRRRAAVRGEWEVGQVGQEGRSLAVAGDAGSTLSSENFLIDITIDGRPCTPAIAVSQRQLRCTTPPGIGPSPEIRMALGDAGFTMVFSKFLNYEPAVLRGIQGPRSSDPRGVRAGEVVVITADGLPYSQPNTEGISGLTDGNAAAAASSSLSAAELKDLQRNTFCRFGTAEPVAARILNSTAASCLVPNLLVKSTPNVSLTNDGVRWSSGLAVVPSSIAWRHGVGGDIPLHVSRSLLRLWVAFPFSPPASLFYASGLPSPFLLLPLSSTPLGCPPLFSSCLSLFSLMHWTLPLSPCFPHPSTPKPKLLLR
jgi:hypothetical protein